ncbi:MAG: SNF2-related protein, partial [Nitrosopumilaceae archaeon]
MKVITEPVDLSKVKNFGTLEYVLDKYSRTWTWKVTGSRAVTMVSRLIPQSWYGEGPNEAIIPDSPQNVQQIQWILERYPMEILSKSTWRNKISKSSTPQIKLKKIEKLSKATPSKQFRGKLHNFQKEGLDFLLKSSGNALLADEMGLGKTVQTLAYLATEKQALPALVIAPLVTLRNWQREIGNFMKKKSRNGRLMENEIPSSTVIRKGKSQEIG